MRIFCRIKRRIKNLIKWLPTIWHDEQWDYHYIYKIIEKKLELIEQHMKSDFCLKSVNQDKYIKQIQICKYLTSRLIKDEYLSNALIPHKKVYGKNASVDIFDSIPSKYGRQLIDKRPAKQRKHYRKWTRHSSYMRNQDKNMLFDCLKKYINNFWD